MRYFWEEPQPYPRLCSWDFGISEAAAASSAAEAGSAAASSAAAASTAAETTAAAGTAATASSTAASAVPWLQGAAALTSLAGVAGSTRAHMLALRGQGNIAEMEAQAARNRAAYDATQTDRANKLMIARGVATAAASGLDVSGGSPLLNELANVKQASLQKQTILNQGEMSSSALDYQARLARAGIPGAITEGVARGGSVISSWMTNRYVAGQRLGMGYG